MQYQEIIELVKKSNGKTLGQIIKSVKPADRALIELQVMMLARDGRIKLVKNEFGDYLVRVGNKISTRLCFGNEKKIGNTLNPKTKIVVTMPTSLHRECKELGSISSTDKIFRSLLRDATTYVKLCLPFPEEAVASYFSEEITNLAKDGVRIMILTREVFAKNKSHANLVKSLMRLYDIYRSFGDANKIEIRDFHIGLKNEMFNLLHYESVHAKIILIDGMQCYIGSGEWRINSLYNNFELGVVLRDEIVSTVESLYDLIWHHSKSVTYEFLTKMHRRF